MKVSAAVHSFLCDTGFEIFGAPKRHYVTFSPYRKFEKYAVVFMAPYNCHFADFFAC